ncbi:hypothetical protein Bbelb_101120 [Branchiostoma belcheri]|nr:hypothetical protein Bbelb_101120 [Branchiostoma belcheri]
MGHAWKVKYKARTCQVTKEMEQKSVVVLRLTAGETAALAPGVNLICKEAGNNFIIYKDIKNSEEPYKACRNICKHQGGTFLKDVEDTSSSVLRCTKHGWKLDSSTMKYVNPPDSFSQEKLGTTIFVPELDEDGRLALLELIPPEPWDNGERPRQTIQPGEVQLTFFAHACMELRLGDKTMFFDPWLTGPAFARGWWLLHEPPADWLERLSLGLHQKADRALVQGSPDIWRLHIPPNMFDFPQRLQKFTEALKGLVQSYPKVTVWDHRHDPGKGIMLGEADCPGNELIIDGPMPKLPPYPTLALLSEKNPNIPIYVGDTSMPVFCKLEQSGVQLNNINVCSFGVWQEINADLRFMILMDGVHPDMDTCILVDYKGHFILNTVDCTQPNGGRLPKNVDIMMSDFAGGASGFPMTFHGGRYTDEWKAQFIATERKKLLYYKTQVVRDVNPRVYCPFAGYFVEAYPGDKYIRDTNTKNSAEQLNSLINRYSEHIITWTPKPGATLDLALILDDKVDRSLAIVDPPPGTKIYKDSWNFDFYIDEINESIGSEIFAYPDWIPFYYKWAGFRDYNLVLRNTGPFRLNGQPNSPGLDSPVAVIYTSGRRALAARKTSSGFQETDDDFHPVEGGYDFLVDFSDLSFPEQRPHREHAYLEVKNRIGVHRQTVLKGLFWDDLYIGFQNRISRDPDTFHYKFWNHMQILLPEQPPDWTNFLRQMHKKPARAVWKPSGKGDSIVSRLLKTLSKAKALLVPGIIASVATAVYFAVTIKQ